MFRRPLGLLTLLAALAAFGCNNSTPAPTAPTGNAVAVVTESFSGTLAKNGATTHPFVVGTPGTISATLNGLAPDDTIAIGMSLGTWNTTTESCAIVIANDNATKGRVILGTAQNSGAFCVRVYDVGKVVNPTEYSVTVTHQ